MDTKEKLVELLDRFVYDDWYDNNDIAEKLISNGVTVHEWVSATKRLPEHEDVVLCFMKFGEHRMLQWDNVSSLWLGDGHGDDWQKADVTHWMPLPMPPKGE